MSERCKRRVEELVETFIMYYFGTSSEKLTENDSNAEGKQSMFVSTAVLELII